MSRRIAWVWLILCAFLAAFAGTGLAGDGPSQEETAATYELGGRSVRFLRLERDRLVVSADCRKGPAKKAREKLRCEALRALRRTRFAKLSADAADGGRNPGARLCAQVGGSVMLGTDGKGNQSGFCRFKDGSFASLSTLSYAAAGGGRIP